MTQPEQRSGPLHPPVTRARPSTRCRARWVQPGCCLRITTQGCSIPIQESLIWIRPVSTRRFRCDTAQNNFKIIVFLGQKTSYYFTGLTAELRYITFLHVLLKLQGEHMPEVFSSSTGLNQFTLFFSLHWREEAHVSSGHIQSSVLFFCQDQTIWLLNFYL